MALQIEVFRSDSGKCKVELHGRLDTNTAPQLDEKLAGLDSAAHPVQVLDMAGLEYISSAGLRSIFKAKKDLEAQGGRLLLVNPQPQVRKVFEIIKALPTSDLFTSFEEMDEYLANIQQRSRTAGA